MIVGPEMNKKCFNAEFFSSVSIIPASLINLQPVKGRWLVFYREIYVQELTQILLKEMEKEFSFDG